MREDQCFLICSFCCPDEMSLCSHMNWILISRLVFQVVSLVKVWHWLHSLLHCCCCCWIQMIETSEVFCLNLYQNSQPSHLGDKKNIFYDFMDGFINWLLPELLISRLMPLPRVLACCLPAPAAFSPDISHINIRSYTQMFCLSSFQGKSKTWIFYWTLK